MVVANPVPKLSAEDIQYLRSGGFDDAVITEYIRFITIAKMYRVSRASSCESIIIVPSRAVDAVWVHHIVHTRLYARFCENNFNYLIHRIPDKIGRDGYVATLEKLASMVEGTAFGTAAPVFWPADEYEDSDALVVVS